MLNILELIFINMAFAVTFTGVLINYFEKHIPVFIIKGYKYGCFAYDGPDANFLRVIEIPKSYYKHFYLFSSVLSVLTLIYMSVVYYLGFSMNSYIPYILKIFLQRDEPSVSATAAMVALSLLTLQCVRRLYETYYVQVFAGSSKMNLSHYLAGIIHYFACIIAIIGEAPLFCGDQNRDKIVWTDMHAAICALPCINIFLLAWHEQYRTNVIFANLRKDKHSGTVVTESHRVPYGRFFNFVSSPHRLWEVIMYTLLVILIPTRTFLFIYLWVLGNQIQTAIQAHKWYKKSFKNYPKNRKIIFPYVY